MGFGELLGNDRLKDNLSSSLRRDRISHFYLIAGPEGSGKHTLANLLATAILCQESRRPCGSCPLSTGVLSRFSPAPCNPADGSPPGSSVPASAASAPKGAVSAAR